MNVNKYQYKVLKYRFSPILEESVNIGLLIYFEPDRHLRFVYPKSLQRIQHLYGGQNLNTLKEYLHSFSNLCQVLNKNWENCLPNLEKFDFEEVVNNFFLIEDAGVLYFGKAKTGLYGNIEDIVSYYDNFYFNYYHIEKKTDLQDESKIVKKVRNILKKYPQYEHQFEKPVSIVSKDNLVKKEFNLSWLNGKLNIITPLSFDLKDKDNLIDKALRWNSLLYFLSDAAIEQNVNFDIFVAKPSDSNLLESYYAGIKIIQKTNAPKTVREEDELDNYISEAVSYLSRI